MYETAAAYRPIWYKVKSHVHQWLHKQTPLAMIHNITPSYFFCAEHVSVCPLLKADIWGKVRQICIILSPMLVLLKLERGCLIACKWKDKSLILYKAVQSIWIMHLVVTEPWNKIQNIKGLIKACTEFKINIQMIINDILHTLEKPYDLIKRGHFPQYLPTHYGSKESLILPNQYISFKTQTRGRIINHCICCWVPPLPKTFSHFYLFTISSVAMFVCISWLKNLVILVPTPKQEPKGFNTLSNHSKNSLKQCWALDCVHSGHLQAAAHQELRLAGLEAWWQSCVMLAPE